MRLRIWLDAVLCLLLTGCAYVSGTQIPGAATASIELTGQIKSTAASALTPDRGGASGEVLFYALNMRSANGMQAVYSVAADRSGLRKLATGIMPTWSPDGRQIAYIDGDVYVVTLDGATAPRQLTAGFGAANLSGPLWSPDGTHIAFSANPSLGPAIYLVKVAPETVPASSATIQRLNRPGTFAFSPTWSPDSQHIAYSLSNGEHEPAGIAVSSLNALGQTETWLTLPAQGNCPDDCPTDSTPAWSPDGQALAFTSTRDGNAEVYVVEADGSNVTRLTDNDSSDWQPVWSPDGHYIAYLSDQKGNVDIYTMRADGTIERPVTTDPAEDMQPAWSPDGVRLTFVSSRDGNGEVYICNADGSQLLRLTTNTIDDWGPSWRPIDQPNP